MRGIFCLSRLPFPILISGMSVPLSLRVPDDSAIEGLRHCSSMPNSAPRPCYRLPGYRSLTTCQGSLTRFQQLCRAELYYPPQPRHMPLSFHSWLTTAELRLAGCAPSPRVARPRTAIANRCTSPFRWCGGLFMLSGDSPGGAFRGDFLYFPSRHVYNQSPVPFWCNPDTHARRCRGHLEWLPPIRRLRVRELPELWTAHYKGQQICGFCGLRYDPDNATVRRGRTNREAETADSERLAG